MSHHHSHKHASSHSSRRRSPSPRRNENRRREESHERDPSMIPEAFSTFRANKPREDNKNVVQKMYDYQGTPLGFLAQNMLSGEKLVVCTRSINTIRGFFHGTLIYFDKHWNMVFQNVKESAVRPKKGKTPYLEDEAEEGCIEKCDESLKEEEPEIEKPKEDKEKKQTTKRRRKRKKLISLRRRFDNLFCRGDTVVHISQWIPRTDSENE